MQTGIQNSFSFSQSKERTNTLVNSLSVGVLLQGPETGIFFCNKAASAILGLAEAEICRRSAYSPDWEICHEDGSPFAPEENPSAVAIRTKKAVSNVVMGVWRPATDDRVWLQVHAEPLLDPEGRVIEVISSFMDISEHRAAREKLAWLYQNLEMRAFEIAATNADLEKFVYAATHDLQEPLRLISSFVQLLKKKYEHQLDDQAHEYINYAVEGAKRMKRLILDLLEYSKFTGRGMILVPTDMNKIMEEVQRTVAKQLKEANASLILHPLPEALVHPALIAQLFENLIDNALKYRSDKIPSVEISCKEEEGKWQFSVKDNGIGIETGYSEKIFDLFQRLHNNGIYEGTGAGLAICKKIVQLHRGDIWVTSEPGQGSTFIFTIPAIQAMSYEKI